MKSLHFKSKTPVENASNWRFGMIFWKNRPLDSAAFLSRSTGIRLNWDGFFTLTPTLPFPYIPSRWIPTFDLQYCGATWWTGRRQWLGSSPAWWDAVMIRNFDHENHWKLGLNIHRFRLSWPLRTTIIRAQLLVLTCRLIKSNKRLIEVKK